MQKNCQHAYRPEPPSHSLYEQASQQAQSNLSHQQLEPFLKPLPKPPLPDHGNYSYYMIIDYLN